MAAAKHLAIDSESLAINLGHYIRHYVQLKTSMSIMQEYEIGREQANDFRYLMEAQWAGQVHTVTRRRLHHRKLNKNEELPLTLDLVNLPNPSRKKNCDEINLQELAQLRLA